MSKKTNKKTDSPEVEQPKAETTQPAYVKELLEKGVAVIQGRSRGELDEKIAAIPSTVNSTPATLTTTSARDSTVFR